MSHSLLVAIDLTLLRSLFVAAFCCIAAQCALPTLKRNTLIRRLGWLLLLPLIMPPLVIGYAYSNVALSFIRQPLLNNLLYSLLLAMRFFPIALLLLHLAPNPPLSASAMHNLKLAGRRRWVCFMTHGQGRLLLIAFAIIFVFMFSEFEITSRMGCQSWTVWLFDAQVGGMALTKTLTWLSLPASISLLLLAWVFAVMPKHGTSSQADILPITKWIQFRTTGLIIWWLASITLCIIIPWLWVLIPASQGMIKVLGEMSILSEIGYSLLFATISALATFIISLWASRLPRVARWMFCLPGLAGSLVVGLVLLAIFQTPIFHPLYDTPVPIILALLILALPIGLILRPILWQNNSATHAGQLTGLSTNAKHQQLAKHLNHHYHARGLWLLGCILFYMTYHDLPASALLAPSSMSPAIVRLYNLMHYGQYQTLSAMVVLTYGLPTIALAVLIFITSIKGRSLKTL